MRLRASRLAFALGVSMAAAFCPDARAQTAQSDSFYLMNPAPTGDPRSARFGPPPGSGAGTTGFLSTNARKKKRATRIPETPPAPIVVPPPDATLQPVYRPALPARAGSAGR